MNLVEVVLTVIRQIHGYFVTRQIQNNMTQTIYKQN